MDSYPDQFESEEALSHPSTELIELIKELQGDILFLGVSGKMGISMACMAKRACDQAGVAKRIMGVSRFSESSNQSYLQEQGIETLLGDLLDPSFLNSLPEISNIVYLAGIKFGTESQEAYTWAMNAWLPGMVAEKFKDSCIVALSTGCVYPLVSVESGGSIETDLTGPVGEYAQSCLGRERAFEYGSRKHNTPGILVRLNYSVEIRYGVLVDVATKVLNSEPLDVSMGFANVIWQGDANDLILRCFNVVSSPALPINVTGAETLSIRELANKFGEIFGKKPIINGMEQPTALLSNAGNLYERVGKPRVPLDQVILWTAEWVSSEKSLLGKPTHFEVRDGNF